MMEINELSGKVVDCAMKIHMRLGPGLLESVYQKVLALELRKRGLKVETEVPIALVWDGHVIDEEAFRADLIVNGILLVELKSVENLSPVHSKQTLTYLKLLDCRLGLLINIGAAYLKDGINRIANNF